MSLVRFEPPGAFRALAFLLFSLFVAAPTEAQTDGAWEVHLYGNEVRSIAARGEAIYAATSGGAVRYSPGEGFRQWNRAPLGVLSDSLRTVAVDGSGNVWFGTERVGISVLDPVEERWTPFTSLLQPIPGNRIRTVRLQPTNAGQEALLVATEDGYASFRDGDLRFVCQSGVDICGIPSYDVRDIVIVGEDLWIATSGGLVVQHPDGTWEDRSPGFAPSVLEPDGSSLFAADGSTLLRRAGDEWVDVSVGLPSAIAIRDLLVRDRGDVVLAATGSQGGVFSFTGSGWERLGTTVFPATSLAETESGRLYAGAADESEQRDGLWEWSGADWIQRKMPGPSLRAVYRSVYVDGEDRVWFSTAQGGRLPLVGTWDGESWVLRNGGENGALRAWTWAILDAGDAFFLAHCCCSSTDPLCQLESLDESGMFESLSEIREIWALELDADGFLWAATNHGEESQSKGLYRVDPATGEYELFDRNRIPLPSNQIPAVRVQDRVAWVGTFGDGLLRWDFGPNGIPEAEGEGDDVYKLFTSSSPGSERISSNSIRRIEVDSLGRIWVGTTSGLSIYENGVFTRIGSRFDRFPTAEVTALVTDGAGGAWVATRDAGITRMTPDPQGGFVYTNYQAPLLPNPNVNSIDLSLDGRTVWCGTSRGLASFTPFRETSASSGGDLGVYPNPFTPGCADGVRLTGVGGQGSGVVVDLGGRIVGRFSGAEPGAIVWDGTDRGDPVAPGLYVVRVQGPRGTESVGLAVLDGDCGR